MNVPVAISKGIRAVIFFSNRILTVFNWRCQLTQVELYNGRITVVVYSTYQTPSSVNIITLTSAMAVIQVVQVVLCTGAHELYWAHQWHQNF